MLPVAGSGLTVAYRELARGQDWRVQKPVRLCSLRQKVWERVSSFSLYEQCWWARICHVISSEAIVKAVRWFLDSRPEIWLCQGKVGYLESKLNRHEYFGVTEVSTLE